ncbi:glycoside hydrolase family 19 protein [Leptolyngbya boryana CZ1]|uniref:Glycoside hydrolase family 19 protein n=1 Tax=Leptolyngbya boryana CZ1 TaxID=3060204 RepID=A0AA96WU72_LEPBY|nr:glycoside hydrolase family 19 protein [Leptolyngbya boryana]WNZ45647.1 glycoside hydrolase family 19 protein [Leptolyngbya boryana CZ1]
MSSPQLIIWRKQAADRLQQVLFSMTSQDLQPIDAHVDTLLRQLSNLPARPSDRAPYQGSFPNESVSGARVKTVNRLRQLIVNIKGAEFQPQDQMVDAALRSILNLPTRTTQNPYAEIFPETPLPAITLNHLLKIAPYADTHQLTSLFPHLLLTMAEYEISTPMRQAHFLAQLIHESGSFNYLEEIDLGDYLEGREDLGNVHPGDGRRFKGRGLIQITGRANYEACGLALGVNLIETPTRLAEHDLACLSAGWFWSKHEINKFADRDDVETVTRTINGGLNGFADRQYYLEIAKKVLNV